MDMDFVRKLRTTVMGQDPKGRSNPLVIPILDNHTGLSEDGTPKLQRSIVSLGI